MNIQTIATFWQRYTISLPFFSCKVPAGFPSPADDHLDKSLDLNEHLVSHPAATFFCRVSGDSMEGLGIYDGYMLIVDRALEPKHGDIVLALLDDEITCKTLDTQKNRLLSSNDKYKPIPIREENSLVIEGVVTHWIGKSRVRTG